MKEIRIEKVTKQNWKKACMIDIKPEQKRFIGSVAYCIARAYINPYANPVEPYVIYKKDEVVGFFWFTIDSCNNCILCGFRIDKNYQRMGISKPAIGLLKELLLEKYPECSSIQLFVEDSNEIAKKMYKSFGFDTKRRIDPDLELMMYKLKEDIEIKLVDDDYLEDG